ncbi:hypothetical protein MPER_09483, partial [Moniliophthora perniciosa FA553]
MGADFKLPWTLELASQEFFKLKHLTHPPAADTIPSRFQLLHIWATAVIINKAEFLWPLFLALQNNTHFDFPIVLEHTGPNDLQLCLLCCLAFQTYGPAFILDWLHLFQSSIEQLLAWDGKLKYYHPQVWQWFGHADTYANLRIKGVDPTLDLPLPDFEDRSSFFDFRAQFGLRDQSHLAFRDHFGFNVSKLPGY